MTNHDVTFKHVFAFADTLTGPARWIALGLLLAVAACAPHARPTVFPGEAPAPLRVQLSQGGGTTVVSMPLETYVRGVIMGEISVAATDRDIAHRVYELQAILARTYAVANRGRHARQGFDLCDGTHCQVFRRHEGAQPEWRSRAADRAVASTAGAILLFQGRPIQSVYHAHCGGHTNDATSVWGGPRPPYLAGVDDPYCRETPSTWTYRVELDRLREVLNRQPSTQVGRTLDRLEIETRDPHGVVTAVRLVGEANRRVRGETLRAALNATLGATAIRSPRYAVSTTTGAVSFSGTGSGHGAGLCQTGAVARLRRGELPDAIVRAYYPGIDVGRAGR